MKTLLTNAKVIDPVTETISDGEIMFEDGIIISREKEDKTIDCQGLYLSPGLIDLGVKVGEPGFGEDDDIEIGRPSNRLLRRWHHFNHEHEFR